MEIRDFLYENRPGNKGLRIWNNIFNKTDVTREYHEQEEYIMEPLDRRLTIRINHIDNANGKIFIDFYCDISRLERSLENKKKV